MYTQGGYPAVNSGVPSYAYYYNANAGYSRVPQQPYNGYNGYYQPQAGYNHGIAGQVVWNPPARQASAVPEQSIRLQQPKPFVADILARQEQTPQEDRRPWYKKKHWWLIGGAIALGAGVIFLSIRHFNEMVSWSKGVLQMFRNRGTRKEIIQDGAQVIKEELKPVVDLLTTPDGRKQFTDMVTESVEQRLKPHLERTLERVTSDAYRQGLVKDVAGELAPRLDELTSKERLAGLIQTAVRELKTQGRLPEFGSAEWKAWEDGLISKVVSNVKTHFQETIEQATHVDKLKAVARSAVDEALEKVKVPRFNSPEWQAWQDELIRKTLAGARETFKDDIAAATHPDKLKPLLEHFATSIRREFASDLAAFTDPARQDDLVRRVLTSARETFKNDIAQATDPEKLKPLVEHFVTAAKTEFRQEIAAAANPENHQAFIDKVMKSVFDQLESKGILGGANASAAASNPESQQRMLDMVVKSVFDQMRARGMDITDEQIRQKLAEDVAKGIVKRPFLRRILGHR